MKTINNLILIRLNMFKIFFSNIIVVLINITGFTQNGDDGWNDRTIYIFENNTEKARISLTFLPGFDTQDDPDLIEFNAFIDPDLPYLGGTLLTNGDFNMNFIRIFSPIHNNATQDIPNHSNLDYSAWNESIQYYNGLGRLSQRIDVKGSPVESDIIHPIDYDDFGREIYKFLPYTISQGGDNGSGGYRNDFLNEQINFNDYFFDGEGQYAKSTTNFENSPLNRVSEEIPPGEAWNMGDGHKTEYQYNTNTSSSEVYNLEINENNELMKNGYYSVSKLIKTIITDENNHQSLEYKDMAGEVVCKMVYDGVNWLKTYYVYNDYGLLRYVIPPEASGSYLNQGPSVYTFDFGDEWILNYCFYYEYDYKKRMTTKRLPGCDPIYLVYNKRDQLILMQDGNSRNDNDWLFTKYDMLNRHVIKGKYHHNSAISQAAMQIIVDDYNYGYNPFCEESNLSFEHGYTNNTFPDLTSSGCEVNIVIYYDNYNYISQSQFNGKYAFKESEISFMYSLAPNIKGKVTASKTKILPNSEIILESGISYLISVNFYDKYYHLIQTLTDNHLGGLDVVSSKVNFTGEVLLTKENHTDGINNINIQKEFEYDNGSRLLKTNYKINNENWITLNEFEYDELGQIKRKYLHGAAGSALQTINIKYNIRGWLTDINDVSSLGNDLFALKLGYITGNYPQYNGNIASMEWQTEMFSNNSYQYNYDAANRLSGAEYSGTGNYTCSYNYDKNGNIMSLSRQGKLGESSQYAFIDELTYSYTGNELKAVSDINDGDHQDNGFTDNGLFQSTEYTYDENGSLITDLNKGLTIDEYNHVNLPQNIAFDQNGYDKISYLYDAKGKKLRMQVEIDNAIEKTMDYIGNFVYEEGILIYILTDEGRVMVNPDGSYEYDYFLRDHLGNTRITFNENGEIIQEDAFYPFGMQMHGLCTHNGVDYKNKYLYNGKEMQDDFGLEWYDYGLRFYDPQLGRFPTIDPIIENWPNHTPYNYAFSNPVTLVDLWGLQGVNHNAYFNWMARNPMGAIAEGFRQVFDVAASLFTAKAGVSISQKYNLAEVKVGSSSVSTSTVTQSKAEVKFDASGVFDYSGNNQVSLSQLNPFKFETSTSTKAVVEAKTTVVVDGVPVNMSNSQSTNTNGESTNTTKIGVGVSGTNVDASTYVSTSTTTSSDGTTKTNAAAGANANATVIKEENIKTQIGVYLEVLTPLPLKK